MGIVSSEAVRNSCSMLEAVKTINQHYIIVWKGHYHGSDYYCIRAWVLAVRFARVLKRCRLQFATKSGQEHMRLKNFHSWALAKHMHQQQHWPNSLEPTFPKFPSFSLCFCFFHFSSSGDSLLMSLHMYLFDDAFFKLCHT